MRNNLVPLSLVLGSVAVPLGTSAPAGLQLLKSPSARCLDGTQGGYYIRAGSASCTNWVFSLEGGGECVSESDCVSLIVPSAYSGLNAVDIACLTPNAGETRQLVAWQQQALAGQSGVGAVPGQQSDMEPQAIQRSPRLREVRG
jgi:hypothetical protein